MVGLVSLDPPYNFLCVFASLRENLPPYWLRFRCSVFHPWPGFFVPVQAVNGYGAGLGIHRVPHSPFPHTPIY